jgi:hypothetical protein
MEKREDKTGGQEMTNASPRTFLKFRGAQPGNQNARTHGFYAKTLDARGELDYQEAKTVAGLEDEIAMVRAKIKGILRHDPHNIRVLMLALAMLCRLLVTRRQIARDDREGLKEAVADILHDLDLP